MKTAKAIWNAFSSLLVIAVIILAVALVGVRLVGLQPFTVLSGSMEPAYHTGSLIYVKSVDYRELRIGDPITFMLSEDTVATHRIVEIIPDEEDPATLRYRTKGDANESADAGLVHYKNVIGVPVFSIPELGFLVSFIQNPPGTYVAVAVGALVVLLLFLPELLKMLFSDDGKKSDEEAESPPSAEKPPKPEQSSVSRSESRKTAEKTLHRAPAHGGAHSKKGRHES